MEDTLENNTIMASFVGHVVNVLPSIENHEGTMLNQVWIRWVWFWPPPDTYIQIELLTPNKGGMWKIEFDYEEINSSGWKFWGRTKDQVNNRPESGQTMFEKTGELFEPYDGYPSDLNREDWEENMGRIRKDWEDQ